MGEIIPFRHPREDCRSMADKMSLAAHHMSEMTRVLHRVQADLEQAQDQGTLIILCLAGCLDKLRMTEEFCDKCRAACELSDIDQMVRMRDELVREWAAR